MFLKCHSRVKDGKEHRYWNIVENHRCGRGKFVQRQVLYLGEINDTQRESWCRTIEVFDENRPIGSYPTSPLGSGCRCGSKRWSCIGLGNGSLLAGLSSL